MLWNLSCMKIQLHICGSEGDSGGRKPADDVRQMTGVVFQRCTEVYMVVILEKDKIPSSPPDSVALRGKLDDDSFGLVVDPGDERTAGRLSLAFGKILAKMDDLTSNMFSLTFRDSIKSQIPLT
ncbi:hypothetical protein DPX16_5719 [Anabarilius grahami]|uniref:Uncharacterized protein n=1 Tax=Anabarilius grahami TaxID=495550 RepID=A0A3N0YQ46_ANAGA|nr:hypothetical protein DPX16_5719 [Anabarilius grahami]